MVLIIVYAFVISHIHIYHFGQSYACSGEDPAQPHASSYEDMLLDHLFTDRRYVKASRPAGVVGCQPSTHPTNVSESPHLDRSTPHLMTTVVNVSIDLLGVQEVDMQTQTITPIIYHQFSWLDPRLTWDPELYGGIQYFVYPQSKLWVPR